MRSLWGDGPPHEVMGIPLEPAKEQGPIWIAGSMMFSAWLLQDSMSGVTFHQHGDLLHEPSGPGGYPLSR